MRIFACLLALCVVGALAAPDKNEEPKRDKRGYLTGAHAHPGYGYSGLGYGGDGYLGYAGHGGYLGYAAPVNEIVATNVIAAPALSYESYPYNGGHYVNSYPAPHAVYGGW